MSLLRHYKDEPLPRAPIIEEEEEEEEEEEDDYGLIGPDGRPAEGFKMPPLPLDDVSPTSDDALMTAMHTMRTSHLGSSGATPRVCRTPNPANHFQPQLSQVLGSHSSSPRSLASIKKSPPPSPPTPPSSIAANPVIVPVRRADVEVPSPGADRLPLLSPGPSQRMTLVGGYQLGTTLGIGSFGHCRQARHVSSNAKTAMKVVDKSELKRNPSLWFQFKRETASLWALNHPHIVRVYEVLPTHNHIYMCMELATGGELYEYCESRKGPLPEAEARVFFRQMVDAVVFAHRRGIVHRDLKLENVLLDSTFSVKVSDWGMSMNFPPGEPCICTDACGSWEYAAPEIVMGKHYDGRYSDAWSLGVCLFAMVSAELPFDAQRAQNDFLAGQFKPLTNVSPSLVQLITGLFDPDPHKRLTLEEAARHPWTCEGFDGPQLSLESRGNQVEDASHIDESIVKLMHAAGYPVEDVSCDLVRGKNTPLTATYYIVSDLKRKQGLAPGFALNPQRPKKA